MKTHALRQITVSLVFGAALLLGSAALSPGARADISIGIGSGGVDVHYGGYRGRYGYPRYRHRGYRHGYGRGYHRGYGRGYRGYRNPWRRYLRGYRPYARGYRGYGY